MPTPTPLVSNEHVSVCCTVRVGGRLAVAGGDTVRRALPTRPAGTAARHSRALRQSAASHRIVGRRPLVFAVRRASQSHRFVVVIGLTPHCFRTARQLISSSHQVDGTRGASHLNSKPHRSLNSKVNTSTSLWPFRRLAFSSLQSTLTLNIGAP